MADKFIWSHVRARTYLLVQEKRKEKDTDQNGRTAKRSPASSPTVCVSRRYCRPNPKSVWRSRACSRVGQAQTRNEVHDTRTDGADAREREVAGRCGDRTAERAVARAAARQGSSWCAGRPSNAEQPTGAWRWRTAGGGKPGMPTFCVL
jgi:hypothetical protein